MTWKFLSFFPLLVLISIWHINHGYSDVIIASIDKAFTALFVEFHANIILCLVRVISVNNWMNWIKHLQYPSTEQTANSHLLQFKYIILNWCAFSKQLIYLTSFWERSMRKMLLFVFKFKFEKSTSVPLSEWRNLQSIPCTLSSRSEFVCMEIRMLAT